MRVLRATVLLLAGLLALSACAPQESAPPSEEPTVITVAAAASLQRAFGDIQQSFEKANPDIRIESILYDGSSTLATQILEGAPINVFASADTRNMRSVQEAGLTAEPRIFATNTLVIAVPKGNPGHVTSLADLADATTVLCAPQVPCGHAAQELLHNASVKVTPASMEQNVTAVLAKVAAGEAEAGLVYATDVAGDDAVESIRPDGADEVVNYYPAAALTVGEQSTQEAAQRFVDFVAGGPGQQILARYGFGARAEPSEN
ncbi:molybdate ABC transporter substrate-binding protein [Glutamicibacter endophyticus]